MRYYSLWGVLITLQYGCHLLLLPGRGEVPRCAGAQDMEGGAARCPPEALRQRTARPFQGGTPAVGNPVHFACKAPLHVDIFWNHGELSKPPERYSAWRTVSAYSSGKLVDMASTMEYCLRFQVRWTGSRKQWILNREAPVPLPYFLKAPFCK